MQNVLEVPNRGKEFRARASLGRVRLPPGAFLSRTSPPANERRQNCTTNRSPIDPYLSNLLGAFHSYPCLGGDLGLELAIFPAFARHCDATSSSTTEHFFLVYGEQDLRYQLSPPGLPVANTLIIVSCEVPK